MSLTALIRHPTPVRNRMSQDFPRPKLRVAADLRVPRASPSPSLIGTAFDYLLRFYLQRANSHAVARKWVAERAHKAISSYGDAGILLFAGERLLPCGKVRDCMARYIRDAKRHVAEFMAGESLSTDLLRSTLKLAHCDPYYRSGRIGERFGRPRTIEIEELRQLAEATDWSVFESKRVCLLNPTFGQGSTMIGGADADLLLDDTLIDVKTVGDLRVTALDWRQLIGYAALNVHFPIGGGKPHPIRKVGFYFSRHAHLVTWPLAELVDMEKFAAFAAWLRDYAVQMHAEQVAREERWARYDAQRKAEQERERELERTRRARRRKRARKSAAKGKGRATAKKGRKRSRRAPSRAK